MRYDTGASAILVCWVLLALVSQRGRRKCSAASSWTVAYLELAQSSTSAGSTQRPARAGCHAWRGPRN